MQKIETLYKTPWLELKNIVDEEKGVKGYVISHEVRCQGKIVAVLPFKEENGTLFFLIRHEYTPCWDAVDNLISSITGGVDKVDSPEQTAVHELKEEAGYEIELDQLVPLGKSKGIKSSDTDYYLFGADLTNSEYNEKAEAPEDLEGLSHNEWVTHSEFMELCQDFADPMLSVMYTRLMRNF